MLFRSWLGILAPEQYGGQALGFGEMRIVTEGLAQALIPEPFIACAALATRVLVHSGNTALMQTLLPAMIAGEKFVALAWQEGLAGTDASCANLHAMPSSNGMVLDGKKRFVTPASGADGFIVSASQAGTTSLYYVAADTPGLSIKLEKRSDGTFSGELTFANVVSSDLVASGEAATTALARALYETAILASCELFAVMSRALATTVEYMKTRVQFGKPIGSFQGLQHRAVDLLIQKELSSALLDDVIRELDATPDMPLDRLAELAHRCKSRCSDAGMDITRESKIGRAHV